MLETSLLKSRRHIPQIEEQEGQQPAEFMFYKYQYFSQAHLASVLQAGLSSSVRPALGLHSSHSDGRARTEVYPRFLQVPIPLPDKQGRLDILKARFDQLAKGCVKTS